MPNSEPSSMAIQVFNSEAYTFLEKLILHIDYAYQPIVHIHSGSVYGYEALLRGYIEMGFGAISDVFDMAWNLNVLHQADMILRQKALKKFSTITGMKNSKLFYNLDGRCFESPDYAPEKTQAVLKSLGIHPNDFCLELSECYNNGHASHTTEILNRCRAQFFRIALDDYGEGFSQLRMLYDHQPDYLKIDRFFIDGISCDDKKRLMVSTVTEMSHTLGITVVVEGVETSEDFITCRNIGCDLVQGYFIEKPQTDVSILPSSYDIVTRLTNMERRDQLEKTDRRSIEDRIEKLATIRSTNSTEEMIKAFRDTASRSIVPVVDEANNALGIIREVDIKSMLYNQYGHALLANKGFGPINRFIKQCPITDLNSSIEQVLEMYVQSKTADGIIITNDLKYVGFLSAQSLLQLLNEKRMAQAQDQNPLTKLPGNQSIAEYMANSLKKDRSKAQCIVYFDLNSFKPFNDHYGFRQGDRAILLFAEIMQRHLQSKSSFLGHIGGDDFFAGFENQSISEISILIKSTLERFAVDVESFYNPIDREKGYIERPDRDGTMKHFAMLTCSAAIVEISPDFGTTDQNKLSDCITALKKSAKNSKDYIASCKLA